MFMHAQCAVAYGSCNTSIEVLLPQDAHYGDWRYAQSTQGEQKAAALAFIAAAEEEELRELAAAIVTRREEILQKHEL